MLNIASEASIRHNALAVFGKVELIKNMDAQSCVTCMKIVERLLQQCVTAHPSKNKFETSKY
jgi:hypothetical protein